MMDALNAAKFALPSDLPMVKYWIVVLASDAGPKAMVLDQL
jgi:hypothetical protein